MKAWVKAVLRFVRYYSTLLIIFVPMLLLLPLPLLVDGDEAKCGYMVLLMATYWCTEVLPLGITALIPVVFCPLMNLVDARDITTSYMENTTMILVGGLLIAIAVENTNLHRRIALSAVLKIGASPRWLVLGFMLPTWILSMWVSNTATVAMMIPIVEQVLKSLEDLEDETGGIDGEMKDGKVSDSEVVSMGSLSRVSSSPSVVFTIGSADDLMENLEPKWNDQKMVLKPSSSYTSDMMEDTPTLDMDVINEKIKKNNKQTKTAYLGRALTISVAYAANAGGTGTLIGTTVNIIFKGMADDMWKKYGYSESPVNFASWMILAVPIAVINLIIIWIWLEIYFVGFRDFCGRQTEQQKQEEAIIKQILTKEHAKLGPMRVPEIQTAIYFVFFIFLLFFREPGFMPGWNTFFNGYASDATAAIALAILLFAIPFDYKKGGDKKAEPLVTWKSMREKFAWDVVLLLGGGFALAEATSTSGLSDLIGEQLAVLENLPLFVLVLIVGLLMTVITQFTSNQATASLFLPILGNMAEKMGKSPLMLMFPVIISVQYAFMLPIATTPNAICFSTGRLTVLDMIKAGAFLNVICTFVMALSVFTWGDAYFDLHTLPWDPISINTTAASLQAAVGM